jgi:hypothetical protein
MVVGNANDNALPRLRAQCLSDDRCCVVTKAEVVDGDVERCSRFADQTSNPPGNFRHLGCSLWRRRERIAPGLLKKRHLDVASGKSSCFKRHSRFPFMARQVCFNHVILEG